MKVGSCPPIQYGPAITTDSHERGIHTSLDTPLGNIDYNALASS